VKGSNYDLIPGEALPWLFSRESEENHEKRQVRLTASRAGISTMDLSGRKEEF
jgi:hypothetical protein